MENRVNLNLEGKRIRTEWEWGCESAIQEIAFKPYPCLQLTTTSLDIKSVFKSFPSTAGTKIKSICIFWIL